MTRLAASLCLALVLAPVATAAKKPPALKAGHVYVYSAAGKRLRDLPVRGLPRQPAWSPDATQLAFVAAADPVSEPLELWVVRGDGRGLHRVDTGVAAYSPTWSPDGLRLAFVTLGSRYSPGPPTLDVVGADGKGLRTLLAPASEPAWSARDRIAYLADGGLWTMQSDGSGSRRVATPAGLTPGEPAWTLDGARLAFTLFDPKLRRTVAAVAAADGSGAATLTPPGFSDSSPAWSPDGTRVAVLRENAVGYFRVAIAPVAGGPARSILALPANRSATLDWSARGELAIAVA